jgi:hypothetical protein
MHHVEGKNTIETEYRRELGRADIHWQTGITANDLIFAQRLRCQFYYLKLTCFCVLKCRCIMKSVFKIGSGLVAAGSSMLALQNSSNRHWDLSSLGVVRFGRAAVAVAVVIADYKWTLRGIDPQSEQYQEIQSSVRCIIS